MSLISRMPVRAAFGYLVGQHVTFRLSHMQSARDLKDKGFDAAASIHAHAARYHNRMALQSLKSLRQMEAA